MKGLNPVGGVGDIFREWGKDPPWGLTDNFGEITGECAGLGSGDLCFDMLK